MNTQLITIRGTELTEFSASAEAIARRDELLAVARRGSAIANDESAQRAAAVLKDLKAFSRMIEASRKEAKDPVLTIGKKIDELAGKLTTDIKHQEERIGSLLAAWQEQQRKAAEEARRKAYEEEQRIIREQQERERKAREEAEAAERARREAEEKARREAEELAAKASRARSAERQAELQAEAEAKRKAAEEAAEKAEAERIAAEAKLEAEREAAEKAIVESRTELANAAPAKLAGMALRSEIKFEVTDVYALFEALPGMVTLTPNTAALKAYLKTLPEGQTLPGVRHWREAKTTVR
jgi:hypothetical protein